MNKQIQHTQALLFLHSVSGNGSATESCRHGYWYDPDSGYDSTLVTEVKRINRTCIDKSLLHNIDFVVACTHFSCIC